MTLSAVHRTRLLFFVPKSGARITVAMKAFTFALVAGLVLAAGTTVHAAAGLTITPLTWNIVGLDSNNPVLQGPHEFLSGARVCNTGPDAANNLTVNYIWDSANPYINISPRGQATETQTVLFSGECEDFYFLIRVTRTPLAFNTLRRYHITASATNAATVSTPTPRELYVEKLISQNRNDVVTVTGPTSVYVGQSVNYSVQSFTATQGYEQLSSFLDFPNLQFRILEADVTYSAPPGGTNDRVYSDACGWDPVPGPTPPAGTYRSCTGVGKAGGDVQTNYNVRFQSAGTSTLIETIYDFSGSSFHYNADIGLNNVNISVSPPLANIQFNKHCQPAPSTPGSTFTCTIEYGNTSLTQSYSNVEIEEFYDPRTSFVSAAPSPTSGNNLWNIGTLSPGEFGVITVTLTVAGTGVSECDMLLNRAEISDDTARANDSPGDPPGMFNYAEDTTTITMQSPNTATLRVSKTGTPDPGVAAGGTLTYTINYQNLGPATSYGTVLTDVLPAGATFVSSVPAPSTSSAPTYTWNLGNLASGSSGSIVVTAVASSSLVTATMLTNNVSVQGQTGAGTISSCGLFADVEETQFVLGGAQALSDLSIAKSDNDLGVPQGGILTYTMTVQNAGPDVATNVVVTDTLGPNKTFASSSLGSACTNVSGTVTCNLGTMAVGASQTFTINVTVSAAAPTAGTRETNTLPCNGTEDICNNVSVASGTTDPNAANNTSDEPTNVLAVASVCDLSMTKTHAGGSYAPGATITYNLTLSNSGPNATGSSTTSFVDSLPTNVTYVSSSFTGGGSCGTPDANNNIICAFSGNVPSGGTRTGSITVTVNANAPTAGSQTTGACTGSEDLCNRILSIASTGCRDTNPANNTVSAAADVLRPVANLGLTKTDSPDPVPQGDTLTYTLNVTNAGPNAATNVDVVDTLPSNVTYVSSTASGGCSLVGSALTCRVADLANGGSTSFTITVRVNSNATTTLTPGILAVTGACTAGSADLCNSATVSSYSTDPTPANNTATQPTNVTSVFADLQITKTDTGDPLMEGGVLVYTLQVSNLGTGTARGVTVTDTLSPYAYFLESTASGGCVESPAGTVTCSLGDLANLATTSFTISVFYPTGTPTAGIQQNDPCTFNAITDVCNTATVSSFTPDPVPANNTAVEPSNILAASADLQITKTDTGSDPTALSGLVTYQVHVENVGPQDAQDVVVIDTFDANTTYVSDTFGCVHAPTGTLTCDIGAMLVGHEYDFEITVQVSPTAPTAGTVQNDPCTGSPGTDLCNTITVSSSTSDPVPANNTAAEPTNVLAAAADVSVTKSDSPDPVLRGGTLTYTIAVTNNGPNTATGVVVSDTLDPDTTFVSAPGCTHLSGVVTCNVGSLANGASTTLTVTTTVSGSAPMGGSLSAGPCDGSEDLCNNVSVSSSLFDTVPGNNVDSEPTDVTPSADVAVNKTGPASVVPGTNVVYTTTITNNGPGDALNVNVADATPSGLTFVSNAGDCTGAFPCSLGTLASGATRTITSTYSVPPSYTTPDPVVNTATASTASLDTNALNDSDSHSAPVALQVDLAITKDDGTAVYTAGGSLTYTITVTNSGPSHALGATVTDVFPPQLSNVSWSCAGASGGACTASGSGDINDTVDVPVGATVTYLVSADVIAGTTVNPLVNTATVAPPPGATDTVPGNDSDSDSDTPTAAPSAIGDRLWLDEDGDGNQDAGEDGLAGVTVGLYDAAGTVLLATAVTDTDGRYVFTGVAAGVYVVRVDTATLPAGLAANPTWDLDDGTIAPDGETAITAVAGVFVETGDFGFNWVAPATSTTPALGATGAIGDRIWNDADGDGIEDFGEAGIGGVTVRLLTDDNGDGVYGGAGDAAATTTTTDASGHYVFDDLAPGAYVIEVDTTTLPAGFTTTPTGDPDADGDNVSEPVVVAPGDVWVRGDFGYTLPAGSTIGDTIWLDADADGVRDAGEPGLEGVTVVLRDGLGNVVASTTTDATGSYFFPGLPDGTYTVVVTDTAGILFDTPTNTGDPDGGADRSSSVVLAGADDLAQEFGFAPAGHDPGDGLLADTIFLDRDADGLFDAGEGLEGVVVELYDATGTTRIASIATDASGRYVFGGLDPTETYVVVVDTATLPNGGAGLTNTVDPDLGVASRATVDLSTFAGGITFDQDFGYEASTPNTIGGTLWNDRDGDGVLEAGEADRYAGIVVVLRDSDGNVVASTTTDASGNYQFAGLPDGTYTLDVAEDGNALGGLTHSEGPSAGTDGNSQSDTYTLTVAGGATNTTGDFGYYAGGAAVGNFVWSDTDNDGVQDVGEPGLAGALVTLTITWPSGDVTSVVTTTDALGAYAFGNLLLDEDFDGAGTGEPTYSISVATPAGFQASPIGQGGNAQTDSNDQAGTAATASEGVTDTTDDTLVTNGIDFGFTPLVDVAVTKSGPATVVPGTSAVFTIVVTNNGPGTAQAVSVADPTPSGLSFVSNTGDCTTVYPCSLGALASGATRTITTTYSVPASYTTPDPVVNTATVSTTSADTVPANDSDSASATVAASADMAIVKSGPGAVTPGNNVVYTILVTNNGTSDAAGVSVADPTPAGLTFVSNTGSCTTAFPCSLGTVPAGATRTITSTFFVPVAYTSPDPIVNTATVSTTTSDPVPANDTDDASTGLSNVQSDLAVTKTGPASATPGTNVVFTVTVTNNGPAAATSTTVTDPTPGGLTFVSNTGDCTTAYPCSLGTLASGATRTITSTYSVPAGYAGPNPISNTATVSSAGGDPVPGNDTDTETVPVSPSADVAVVKSGPAQVAPGSNAVFTIVVTNNGPSNAAAVSVADPTPAGLTFVSNSGSCTTAYPCALGTLAPGATRTITTTYAVPPSYAGPDPVVNTATVSTTTTDPVPGNDSDSHSAPVAGGADLAVVKSDAGTGAIRNGSFSYTIVVTNNGPADATNVVAVDTLDGDTTYVSDTAGCTGGAGGTLTCALGALAAGASTTFNVTVTVDPSAPDIGTRENGNCIGSEDLCNTVTVDATEPDPVAANNTETEPTNVASASLSVVKSDSGRTVNRLEDFAYTIAVTNTGAITATNVVAVDTLDSFTTFVSSSIPCTEAPAGRLTCSIGTLLSGATATFYVIVQTDADAPVNGGRESGPCNGGEDLCNSVVVSAAEGVASSTSSTDDEPTNVEASSRSSDLSITKVNAGGAVQAGSFATYTISVANAGPDEALGVQVVDTLDPNTELASATIPCTAGVAGLVQCDVGDLASGATVDFEIVVHVDPAAPTGGSFAGAGCPGGQDLCNRASVSSTSSDPDPLDNASSVSTNVIPTTAVSQLSLSKSDLGTEPVLPGSNVTYQIVVNNAGPNAAADVVVLETLDEYMTYVSDTAGCVATTANGRPNTTLACPLGTVAAGATASFDLVVTLAADAPVDSTMQDGDCANVEDVCNDAFVMTSSADFSIVDNADSEPTDVSLSLTCNDGIIDVGETCDPPDAEVCNNTVDDDGDNEVDCSDPDCQTTIDGCNGNCLVTPACQPILNDPAKISWNRVYIHGQFFPKTDADPYTDGFRFVVSNDNGEVYSAELLPGDVEGRERASGWRWIWKDRSAKSGSGLRDGLFRVGIHQRERDGQTSYVFTIKGYGNMEAATLPLMTTQVYIGDDTAFLESEWLGKPGAWYLTPKQAYGN